MQAHAADAAQLLKALANEQRLHILCHLLDGPLSVGELNRRVNLSQSALSQHLALLREAGLLSTRDEGARTYYSINWERFDADLAGFLAFIDRARNAPRPVDPASSACATKQTRGVRAAS